MSTPGGAPNRRAPKIIITVGVLFALAALAWTAVGVPALVKYPTDLDASPKYEGTFTLFVNPTTAAALDTPIEAPLTVDRRIQALEDESSASRVVVKETIHQKAGDLVDSTYTNVYVMDRRTMENVDDPRAYAFTPENKVDRSPNYRVQLPFGADSEETYSIYKNETDATYTATGATSGAETYKTNGLTLTRFEPKAEPQPLSAAYLAELNKLVPLPQSLTLEQLKPQLLKMGLDVDATLGALLPSLSQADLATLVELSGKPIALEYVTSFGGTLGVETTTGSEVEVAVQETLGARPMPDNVEALAAVLDRYPQVPQAVAAVKTLRSLATADPIPVFSVDYAQTDASVADIASEVKSQRQMVVVATRWMPWGLGVAGLLALMVGAVLFTRSRSIGEVEAPSRRRVEHAAQPKHA